MTDTDLRSLEARLAARIDAHFAQLLGAIGLQVPEPEPADSLLQLIYSFVGSVAWTAAEIIARGHADPELGHKLVALRVGSADALGRRLGGIMRRQTARATLRLDRVCRSGDGTLWSIHAADVVSDRTDSISSIGARASQRSRA